MEDRELEAIVLDMQDQLRRHAIVIERLATEFHALLMVLTQKRVATLEQVRAAESKLDLASEVARAQELADMTRDLERLDRELDDKDRRTGDLQ
jgi:hypothetical protein